MAVLNRLQNSQPAAKPGSKSYNTFGTVLEVRSVKEEDGQLKLTGVAVNSNTYIKTGEPLSISFRGDAGRSITNFDKGNGKAWRKNAEASAGTVVTLESCYLTGETTPDGKEVSARWLNTLRNVHKPDHEDRSSLEGILAMAPRVTFDNPNPQPNEPARIVLPVVGDKAMGRVTTEHGTFRREFPAEWALKKLNELPIDGGKVRVQIDIVEPRDAVKVNSKEELDRALTTQLSRGTDAFSLVRVSDGETTLTRAVHVGFKKEGDQYLPDVAKALEELHQNVVFSGVDDTAAVFEAVAKGEATMEVVPAYRLSFAGNANQDDNASFKMVSDLKSGKTTRFSMIFGDDASRFAAVILPGMIRGEGESISQFQPINLIGDEHGTFDVKDFATPHISHASKAAPASVPLEDADPSQIRSPADIADSFDKGLAGAPLDEDASRPSP
ncbi:MAG: hypothetical protein EPN79_16020 [Burkholderiaceae bacterium]|nr:MAG: hypothetical protein EPN79_16020 [Burkholderiaceae bacterium]